MKNYIIIYCPVLFGGNSHSGSYYVYK